MTDASMGKLRVGVVVIGRNEAERLPVTLRAALDQCDQVVYVDSGSTDGSVEVARALGVQVHELDPARPFSASRGRNEGLQMLSAGPKPPEIVQFLDGDSELESGWLVDAVEFMRLHRGCGVVVGRTREVRPEASVYNRLADLEWGNGNPASPSPAGNALVRVEAFRQINGYDEGLAAGEDPDFLHRLHIAGWQVERIAAPMTYHDADMHRFGQWWHRTVRTGSAYWLVNRKFRGSSHPKWGRQVLRPIIWVPVPMLATLVATALLGWWGVALLLLYPLQALRLMIQRVRLGVTPGNALLLAISTIVSRFAEFFGVIRVMGAGPGTPEATSLRKVQVQ